MTHGLKDSPTFILRNKRDVSRLQILVEIMEHQPSVRQLEIGKKLGFTPQAISEYIRDLVAQGMVTANGRGSYEITYTGIEWLLTNAEALASYSRHIRHDLIHQVSIWAAVADTDLHAGEKAGIVVRDGFLHAIKGPASASGKVLADARKGHDVGIANLTGVIEHHLGIVHICKVPPIKYGGSHQVRIDQLREIVPKGRIVAAIGLESWIALNCAGKTPDLYFGAKNGIIEAAHHGVDCVLVVTADDLTDVLRQLDAAKITYLIHDLVLPSAPVSNPEIRKLAFPERCGVSDGCTQENRGEPQ